MTIKDEVVRMRPCLPRRTIWILLAFLTGSLSAGGAEIAFKSQATIRGSLVLLGDLADVRDSDPKVVDNLQRIELFPSPARGRQRLLRQVELRQLLQLHGIIAPDHQFSGAEVVRIGQATGDAARAPRTLPQVPEADSRSLAIVVAKRNIASGEILRAVDVELQAVEPLPASVAPLTNPDSVVGKEALRSIAAGQPLDARALRKPILVRRGELVVVVARAAGVRVRTTAKALSEGAHGDVVQLEADGSRQTYSAVVTGLREAEVYASGSSVSDVKTGAIELPAGPPVSETVPQQPNQLR